MQQQRRLQRSTTMEKIKKLFAKWRRKTQSRRSGCKSAENETNCASAASFCDCESADSVKVLVGKSKKPYVISSEILEHPVIRVLVNSRPVGKEGEKKKEEEVAVACEVVLFDHLLWMLRNDHLHHNDSLSELVELYACDL